MIPSTGIRRGHRDALQSSVSPAADAVNATPARGSTIFNSFLKLSANDEQRIPPSSPLMIRKPTNQHPQPLTSTGKVDERKSHTSLAVPSKENILFATPVKSRSKALETPLKQTSILDRLEETPRNNNDNANDSIYKKLGWDDDFDDFM
jgi:DNA replication regulator SLD3